MHLEPAEPHKGGFYLTLFPDGRGPSTVFLRPPQLTQLCDMAASSATTDQQLWDAVARIPLEPLLPSRTLAARLRMLLVDQAAAIRAEVRAIEERIPKEPGHEGGEAPPSSSSTPSSDPSGGHF